MPSASAFAVYSGVSNETCTWRLRGKVVDLGRLHLLHDADKVGRIGQVAVVQEEADVGLVRVVVEVVHAPGVERRGASLDAVHDVALGEQQLGEKRAVLASDAGDERYTIGHRGPWQSAKLPQL